MFTKIDHVAFVVEDLEAWTERIDVRYGLERSGTNDAAHREANGVKTGYFPVGESIVELVEPTTDEGWPADHLREHGEGFFHVAYAVDDIEAAVVAVEAAGLRVLEDEPQPGFTGLTVTLDDADTLVPTQLVQPD